MKKKEEKKHTIYIISKQRERNRRNYLVYSNQILFNEKDHPVHNMGEICYLPMPCSKIYVFPSKKHSKCFFNSRVYVLNSYVTCEQVSVAR